MNGCRRRGERVRRSPLWSIRGREYTGGADVTDLAFIGPVGGADTSRVTLSLSPSPCKTIGVLRVYSAIVPCACESVSEFCTKNTKSHLRVYRCGPPLYLRSTSLSSKS